MDRENKGDYHEAFNLGLDPSLGYPVEEASSDGELQHSDNLWPSAEDWPGATNFVSLLHSGLRTNREREADHVQKRACLDY